MGAECVVESHDNLVVGVASQVGDLPFGPIHRPNANAFEIVAGNARTIAEEGYDDASNCLSPCIDFVVSLPCVLWCPLDGAATGDALAATKTGLVSSLTETGLEKVGEGSPTECALKVSPACYLAGAARTSVGER